MELTPLLIEIFKIAIIIVSILLIISLVILAFIYGFRAYDDDFENQRLFFYRLFRKNVRYEIVEFHPSSCKVDVKDGDFIVTLSMPYEKSEILHQLISKNPEADVSFIGLVDKKKMRVIYVKGFLLKNKE